MIAKGNLHAHGQKLAAYLITGKMGERAELVELKGFASSNIREAFIDVMIQAEATRCEKPFYHAHVRLPDGEALTREQWLYVADRLERSLGFEGQGRAVAFHQDRSSNERHLHVAWSRIDLEQMKAIDPGLYKNKLKQECRGLEKELGLTRVRDERAPEHKTLSAGRSEFEQSRRLGTDLRAIRETVRACWERSDNGRSFEAALAERGCVLARGDRRDFVVIDPAGGDHALGKRILGVAATEIRARLADIDKMQLPSVDAAKAMQAEQARLERVQTTERIAAIKAPSPTIAPAGGLQTRPQAASQEITENRRSNELAAALGRPGLALARVTSEDVKALDALRRDEHVTGAIDPDYKPRYVPEVQPGQLVTVDRFGNVRQVAPDRRNDAQQLAEKQARLPSVVEARGLAEVKAARRTEIINERRAERAEIRESRTAARVARSLERDAAREAHATAAANKRNLNNVAGAAEKTVGRTFGMLGNALAAVGKVVEALANMVSPPAPPTPDQAERQARVAEEQQDAARAAEQQAQHDQLLDQMARDDAQRRRDEERPRDDYDRGRERER